VDIICAKCGMHLNGIEACREHKCPKESASNDTQLHFKVARNTKLSDNEWRELEKHFDISKPILNSNKPLTKELEIGFPKLVLADIPSTRTVKEPMTVFTWVVIAIFVIICLGVVSGIVWGIYMLIEHF